MKGSRGKPATVWPLGEHHSHWSYPLLRFREYIPAPLSAFQRRARARLLPWALPIGFGDDLSDRASIERAADKLLDACQGKQPEGTVERGRLLLRIIKNSFPTQRLSSEYFRNLELLLRAKPRRVSPGKVLLGIGTGRSGSTSLAAMLAMAEDSCCTHENPPLIDWTPDDAQIQFHIRRFKLLADHYSLVADVSHWWLNSLDTFFDHFPGSKVVGLFRNLDECVQSFMNIKGYGAGSLNHWAMRGNGVWIPHVWDSTYPTYAVPSYSRRQPDRAKREMIGRYIEEYNATLRDRAERQSEQVILVQTAELSDPVRQRMIFDLVGASARPFNRRLNVKNVTEGESEAFFF